MPPNPPVILAFDTAAAHCAAAVFMGGVIVAETIEPMKTGQAERLMPLLEGLLTSQSLNWADLDALAVGIGPGNFTGVRLGVAAARGLSMALSIPAIGISALEMRASAVGDCTVILPASRGQAYRQVFRDGHAISPLESVGVGATPDEMAPNMARMAQLAATQFGQTHKAPAPIYLRPADAAPGADAPPRILDAG